MLFKATFQGTVNFNPGQVVGQSVGGQSVTTTDIADVLWQDHDRVAGIAPFTMTVVIDTGRPVTLGNSFFAAYEGGMRSVQLMLGDRAFQADMSVINAARAQSLQYVTVTADSFCDGTSLEACSLDGQPGAQSVRSSNKVSVYDDTPIQVFNPDDMVLNTFDFADSIGGAGGAASQRTFSDIYQTTFENLDLGFFGFSLFATETDALGQELARIPGDLTDLATGRFTTTNFGFAGNADGVDFNFVGTMDSIVFEQAANPNAANDALTYEEVQTVALLFEAALNRDGEIGTGGLNFHIDAREAGLSERKLALQFLINPEFEREFGELDALADRELVEIMFLNVLNRPGNPEPGAGIDQWTDRLGAPDFDEASLLLAFAKSGENIMGSPFIEDLAEVAPGEWAFV